jgi:hypothetical protein
MVIKLNDSGSSKTASEKIVSFSGQFDAAGNANDLFTALVSKDTGNKLKADQIMRDLLGKNHSSKIIQWCNAIYLNEKEQAKSIAKEIDSDDLNFFFMSRLLNEIL